MRQIEAGLERYDNIGLRHQIVGEFGGSLVGAVDASEARATSLTFSSGSSPADSTVT